MATIIPVIMCGGSGTRLWPVSRRSRPKQFLRFGSVCSLFQDTVLRCHHDIFASRPIVVGNIEHRFLIAEQLLDIGVDADILLEPMARGSCATIVAGCLRALERDGEAIILALAADHKIDDSSAFAAAVDAVRKDAEANFFIAFGVKPGWPSSHYGYALSGSKLFEASQLAAFVEKPAPIIAEDYIAQGYLWNTGNFLFRADAFIEEADAHAPEIVTAVRRSFAKAKSDPDFLCLEEQAFRNAPSICVNRAIFEKTRKAAILELDYAWADVGCWDTFSHDLEKDSSGNVVIGDAKIIDGSNNIVHSEAGLSALIGVNDMIVVLTPDCLLVTPKDQAGAVTSLVNRLREENRPEVDSVTSDTPTRCK
ncbi:MAG: sugar phosphate nucleotidyltransferase [Hyphomicrobiales bacterium]